MADAKIGCVTLVVHDGKIIGIACKKGRGNILPGGKWEPGESFVSCAQREYFEETGLTITDLEYVMSGVSEEGYFTYAFTARLEDDKEFWTHRANGDEMVVYTTWDKLKESKFGGFYQLFQQKMVEKAQMYRLLTGQ